MENMSDPLLVMETSWEVCNKIGGIYTVLSSRASTMLMKHGDDGVLFVGPLLRGGDQDDFIAEHDNRLASQLTVDCGLEVRIGRWNIPGQPRVILVDYTSLYEDKGALYYEMWSAYGIRGELGYGDYDESCLFAIAAAKVMIAYQKVKESSRVVSIFNEWTTGMGLLYCALHSPAIHTIFVTHATTVGRSIAGNGKPLYGELPNYDGSQMADELNVTCKHVVERLASHQADVFATVSDVTAIEAAQLLDKKVDMVLYNGFEPAFVPDEKDQAILKADGRNKIIRVAERLYGTTISSEAVIIATSGRNEYRNKGLDVFIDALGRIKNQTLQDVIAVIAVPSWVKSPRRDLAFALERNIELTMPMQNPFLTHELNDPWGHPIFSQLSALREQWGRGVFPLFVPAYLDGKDGILDLEYYDFLSALDLTVFASYYEPWGYTPLESIAFGIPTITTDKAGFGVWAEKHSTVGNDLMSGVRVLHRDDYDFDELSKSLVENILSYIAKSDEEKAEARRAAQELSADAEWSRFYKLYERAIEMALNR